MVEIDLTHLPTYIPLPIQYIDGLALRSLQFCTGVTKLSIWSDSSARGNCYVKHYVAARLTYLHQDTVYVSMMVAEVLVPHDDVIKWNHLPHYWPFVRGLHRSPVNSPHKGQWRGALMFPLICAWTNTLANNEDAGDLKRHRAYYDVIVMHHDHADLSEISDTWIVLHVTCYVALQPSHNHCWRAGGVSVTALVSGFVISRP